MEKVRDGVGESHFRGGSGTPLVLLHPGAGSWRCWRPLLPALTARHEVFAPTLAGHHGGPEFDVGERPGLAALTDHVERYLDAAGLDSVHLAGNSLGGGVALELTRRGRARSVVAISSAGYLPSNRVSGRVAKMIELGRQAMISPGLSHLLVAGASCRRMLLRPVMRHGERVPFGEVLADLRECGLARVILRNIVADGSLPAFDPDPVPVRIAWAQYDHLLPWRIFGAPLAARITGAEILMLPGVGHVPMYDDPALVANTILHMTAAADRGGKSRLA